MLRILKGIPPFLKEINESEVLRLKNKLSAFPRSAEKQMSSAPYAFIAEHTKGSAQYTRYIKMVSAELENFAQKLNHAYSKSGRI